MTAMPLSEVASANDVLREQPDGTRRPIFWIRDGAQGNGKWLRIASLPTCQTQIVGEWAVVAASLIPTIEAKPGLLGRWFGELRRAADDDTWFLPTKASVKRAGARRDGVLIWSKAGDGPLGDDSPKSQWPDARAILRLGAGLLFVELDASSPAWARVAVEGPTSQSQTGADDNPRPAVEQKVETARRNGNARELLAALVDLGAIRLREGDHSAATPLFEESLTIARQLDDRAARIDALGGLAGCYVRSGLLQQAFAAIDEQLNEARSANDPFEEKNALENLGIAHSALRNPAAALEAYGRALSLAKQTGDKKHEATLAWYVAIHRADLGQTQDSIAIAQSAVDIWKSMGDPQASSYEQQLDKFKAASAASTPMAGSNYLAGIAGWEQHAAPTEAPADGPRLLRMAMSLAKSMATYVGSGLKTVSPAVRQNRLRICNDCSQHTGVRCRVCGCFTGAKTWLPHERCPVGKW